MPRRVHIQRGDERFDVIEKPAPDEHALQEVMKANPQLIPADDLGLGDGELLVVGRETVLASGQIDLLCLAKSGDLVLIEFKTGPQNPDFRHALAQVIDYGSDLWGMSVDDFDRGVVQRYLTGSHCDPALRGAQDLPDAISRVWTLEPGEGEALYDRLGDALASGDFVYVVAAQRFTEGMRSSLDYLNASMRVGRFYLVEIVRLEGADLVAHAAQVVAAPQRAQRASSTGSQGQANEVDFLAAVSDDSVREALQDILATCATLGLLTAWGSKGASLRLPTHDRPEPLSIGWVFLPGDQWYGARHVTLGVDESSLRVTPSVRVPVLAYVQQVGEIPGATPVGTSLNAFTFEPHDVPAAKDAIVRALEDLVQAVQGDD